MKNKMKALIVVAVLYFNSLPAAQEVKLKAGEVAIFRGAAGKKHQHGNVVATLVSTIISESGQKKTTFYELSYEQMRRHDTDPIIEIVCDNKSSSKKPLQQRKMNYSTNKMDAFKEIFPQTSEKSLNLQGKDLVVLLDSANSSELYQSIELVTGAKESVDNAQYYFYFGGENIDRYYILAGNDEGTPVKQERGYLNLNALDSKVVVGCISQNEEEVVREYFSKIFQNESYEPSGC